MTADCFDVMGSGLMQVNFEGVFNFLRLSVNLIMVVLILIISFPFLLMLIARLEKQVIHCFDECDENDIAYQSEYTKAVNKTAGDLGFLFCGWFRQFRGGLYQATITAWLSPDLRTLLLIAGGKIAGIDLKKMLLYSMAIDGPILLTCDESKEADLSGLTDTEVLWNADLPELYDLHMTRIASWENELDFFDMDSILDDFELLERKRIRILVNAGLAEYLDYNQNQWRYTWKGAFILRTRFIKSWEKDKLQAYRFGPEFKRPGQEEEELSTDK